MQQRKAVWTLNGRENARPFLALFLRRVMIAFILTLISLRIVHEGHVVWAQQSTQEAITLALEKASLERDKLLEEVKKLREENKTSAATDKIRLESEKLKEEIAKIRRENQRFWVIISTFGVYSSLLVAAIAGLFGLRQLSTQRKDELAKRYDEQLHERKIKDEERFQTIVAGLGDPSLEKRVASVIVLRTFLRKEYPEYYSQVFDLVVTHLQLLYDGSNAGNPSYVVLVQELTKAFKEASPLARGTLTQGRLNAMGVQLPGAYLDDADLRGIWMSKANLRDAHLKGAMLDNSDLSNACAQKVDLRGSHLERANLSNASLEEANLEEAILNAACLAEITLCDAILKNAGLRGVNLTNADLRNADLRNADLRNANLDGANLHNARLDGTDLDGARLTQAQIDSIESCDSQTRLPKDLRRPDARIQ